MQGPAERDAPYALPRDQGYHNRSSSGGMSTAGSAPPDMDAAFEAALSPAISSVQGPARHVSAPRPPRADPHRHQQQLQQYSRPHITRTQSVPHCFEDLTGAEHLMPGHPGFLQQSFAAGARSAAAVQRNSTAQQAPAAYTNELNAALNTIFGPQDWSQEQVRLISEQHLSMSPCKQSCSALAKWEHTCV